MLLLLTLFACDPNGSTTDTGCRTEDDALIALYFDSETCEAVDIDCTGSSVVFQDACGCGCLLEEDD